MKMILSAVILFLSASTVLADIPMPGRASALNRCKNAAKAVAKMNMDQKAQAYSFQTSYVDDASDAVKNGDLLKYSLSADIYRANYTVEVILDTSCAVHSVKIKENLREEAN